MPAVPKNGWPYADSYCGDGWSVAYRTFDAQYWGVPQHRRRIYLVADFGGGCAAEILFEREGVRGYFETGRTPWKGAAADAESGAYVYDARENGDGRIVSTLTGDHENGITDYTSVIVSPVYCLQGNGVDRSETAGCNGKGVKEDISYTLNTIDRHCVAFAVQSIGDYKQSDVSSCLKERDYKGDADLVVECAGVDCRNMNETVELYPTLQAKPNAGQSLNFSGAVRVGYTVRRLTPTECARLQGFPDAWGVPEHKDDFSDEEYELWLNVRNTYAAINSKEVRQYTRQQMLSWYNKLHTDGAEYKMWGNGIALPCALYVMKGIQDVLNGG